MPTPYALSSDLVSAWPAKSLEVATYLDTALAAKTDLAMTQNAQTGTSYSYALADASKLLSMSNAASNTVLVTKQATVTWVTGTQLRVVNLGAGVTTLVADTGVTINGNVSLKQYQGGTLIRTASDVWLFVPTASSSGMDLITPTSVAGTGVTLSGGAVSFSASSTVSVNGCFTSTYENYLIVFTAAATAAGFAMKMRLRLSGTDDSANSYKYVNLFIEPSVSCSRSTATSIQVGRASSAADANSLTIDVFRPQVALRTIFNANNTQTQDSGFAMVSGGYFDATTQFDGFSIFQDSGNITGTLRVYGRRN